MRGGEGISLRLKIKRCVEVMMIGMMMMMMTEVNWSTNERDC